jgi:hypothetical protein
MTARDFDSRTPERFGAKEKGPAQGRAKVLEVSPIEEKT